MIKKTELITEVDVQDINGIIYRKEIMERMVERLNRSKFIPVIVNINPDEYNNPPIGRVLSKTAFFYGKKIYVDIDIEDHVIHLLESNKYAVGTYIRASTNENNEVVLDSNFDIIELQIIKNRKE